MKISEINLMIPLLLTLLAGLATGVGSLISLWIREPKKSYLQFALGLSAGVMIYVSFVELLGTAIDGVGLAKANLAFFAGIIVIMLIDYLVPHEFIEEHVSAGVKDKKMMSAGVFTAIGIAIHNFPEGLAVFMSSVGSLKLGVALACAIAIHNIPEGIAIAMPIFYATKSRKKAFWYSFLSGIAEPVGAVIGILILGPFLSEALLAYSLAFVAGVMVFISFDELLPLAFEHDGVHKSIAGVITGMAVMALSLCLF